MSAELLRRFIPKKQTHFLDALAATGNVKLAAAAAGISPPTAYNCRRDDPAFAAAWDAALAVAMDTVLEPEAIRRAVEGVEKPVYQGGELVGYVREYSDTLLIFLLKGGKPHKYRENIKIDSEVQVTISIEQRTREAHERLLRLRHAGSRDDDPLAS